MSLLKSLFGSGAVGADRVNQCNEGGDPPPQIILDALQASVNEDINNDVIHDQPEQAQAPVANDNNRETGAWLYSLVLPLATLIAIGTNNAGALSGGRISGDNSEEPSIDFDEPETANPAIGDDVALRTTIATQILATPAFLWRTGAIYTFIGIATGAFGAHGLSKRPGILPAQIDSWKTAAHYAAINGVALMAVSLHPKFSTHRVAGPSIALGAALFSGSIYALVLNRDRFKFLGPVTPLGGVALLAGYAALAF
ncbi:hypothetical protein RHS01_04720 [Rhizoctonia solani]|uniref:Uncharacterized protein n=1 Tax=Rhizoctonia solani TaxID=456999 RepID=A0A8H7ID59_9AGAM|nr:hypothetical protein RHS01_04720 [Rhizoctonia solani]